MKSERIGSNFNRAVLVPLWGLVANANIFIHLPARFLFATCQIGLKKDPVSVRQLKG